MSDRDLKLKDQLSASPPRKGGASGPATTLTVMFGGEVPLDLFAQSMHNLQKLIEALAQEVSGRASITWIVEDLATGSAIATIRGESEEKEDVERVVRAFAVVGKSLERNELIPFSSRVEIAAHKMTYVLNGKIT